MNKQELIAKIAETANLPKKSAAEAVDAFTSAVVDAVVNGDSVQLVGFGTFTCRERGAREARNPRTGEKIKIEAAKAPVFKAGKSFKAAVNAPAKKGKKK